jgi:hypothetical protein
LKVRVDFSEEESGWIEQIRPDTNEGKVDNDDKPGGAQMEGTPLYNKNKEEKWKTTGGVEGGQRREHGGATTTHINDHRALSRRGERF